MEADVSQKNTESVEEKLVKGLRPVLAGQPLPLQKVGKNAGIFPAGAAGKTLAQEALARRLVRECPGAPPKTKGAKPFYQITGEGQQFVLDQDSPKEILQGLQAAIGQLAGQLSRNNEPPPAQEERVLDELRDVVATHFNGIQETLQKAAEESRRLSQAHAQKIDHLQQTLGLVEKALGQAREARPQSPAPGTTPPHPRENSWVQEIEPYLRSRYESGTPGDCPLPELYNFLHKQYPALTIGPYHDVLRQLHDEGRIRLSGWTGPLEDIPHPNLAMFLSHRVMYYARLP